MSQNLIDAIIILCGFAFLTVYTIAICEMNRAEKKRKFDAHVTQAMNIANRK